MVVRRKMLKILFQSNVREVAYTRLRLNGFNPTKEDSKVFACPTPMYELDEKEFCRFLTIFGCGAVQNSWDKSEFDFLVILKVDKEEKRLLEGESKETEELGPRK
jgi:hypothetical protein